MGNAAADWAVQGMRDRTRLEDIYVRQSGYYVPKLQSPPKTYLGSGSAVRTVDSEHPIWNLPVYWKIRERGDNQEVRNMDVGGSFASERVTVEPPAVIDRFWPNDGLSSRYQHIGYFPPSNDYYLAMQALASGRAPTIPAELGIDRFNLFTYGSTAIAKSIPDVPEFSLFRFLGELREGLPSLPGKALLKQRKLRNAGGEYLNFQFGIAPTASDLQKLVTALLNPALRVHIKRALNEEHRVRKVVDSGYTRTKRDLTSTELSVPASPYQTDVRGVETRTTSYRLWSSVSFAWYQLTELESLLRQLDEGLGGLSLTKPKLIDLWNLTPWSWLVDWFSNYNHVITNLSYLGRDGLYMQRGYLMATYTDELITRRTCVYMGSPLESIGTRTFTRKYRIQASPFGFGLHWKDFDPFQLSILGSLGVSRLRF